MVFLLGGGECYLVTVDFDLFSGRTCIFVMLGCTETSGVAVLS